MLSKVCHLEVMRMGRSPQHKVYFVQETESVPWQGMITQGDIVLELFTGVVI